MMKTDEIIDKAISIT
jgi:hypothetical protein